MWRDPIGYAGGVNIYEYVWNRPNWFYDSLGTNARIFETFSYWGESFPLPPSPPAFSQERLHIVTYPKVNSDQNNQDGFEKHNKSEIEKLKQINTDWYFLEVDSIDDANSKIRDIADVAKKVNNVPCKCVDTLEITGHGSSLDDEKTYSYALQMVGSTLSAEPFSGTFGFGVRTQKGSFGVVETVFFGFDVFDGISYCEPCRIILRGCNTGGAKISEKMYDLIHLKTGCTVMGFDVLVYAGKDNGLPGNGGLIGLSPGPNVIRKGK